VGGRRVAELGKRKLIVCEGVYRYTVKRAAAVRKDINIVLRGRLFISR